MRLWILQELFSFPILEYVKEVLYPIFKVLVVSLLAMAVPYILGLSLYNNFVGLVWSVSIIGFIIWFVGLNKREKQLLLSKVKSIIH